MVMLFAQHRHNTWNKIGSDWLNIHDTPHYRHLLGGDDYYDYLKLSWKGRQDGIHDKIKEFNDLVADIKNHGIQSPVQIVKRNNGDSLIFHGNHRYAIARYLGIECPTTEISQEEYIRFNIKNEKCQFGTNPSGIAYQSVWFNGECVVPGRRQDQDQRHRLISPEDLNGKRVYDFGCNIGASCVLAHEAGATVEGWDLPEFRTSAIRLAVLMNYDIRYQKPKGFYDTLFLFSVTRKAPIPNIKAKVIYIELNKDDSLPPCFNGAEYLGVVGKRWKMYRYDNSKNCP